MTVSAHKKFFLDIVLNTQKTFYLLAIKNFHRPPNTYISRPPHQRFALDIFAGFPSEKVAFKATEKGGKKRRSPEM